VSFGGGGGFTRFFFPPPSSLCHPLALSFFFPLLFSYCRLQFHFNEYIFKLEQAEYASEGVPVDLIEFKDNQPTLDLLEAKATGVFAMVDEEINVPKGSDEGFLKKVIAKHEKHSNFAKPKPKDLNANLVFIIVHYAGAVPYNVTNFLEKNKDSLHEVSITAGFLVSFPSFPPTDDTTR
jgi:myosin heavy subunit